MWSSDVTFYWRHALKHWPVPVQWWPFQNYSTRQSKIKQSRSALFCVPQELQTFEIQVLSYFEIFFNTVFSIFLLISKVFNDRWFRKRVNCISGNPDYGCYEKEWCMHSQLSPRFCVTLCTPLKGFGLRPCIPLSDFIPKGKLWFTFFPLQTQRPAWVVSVSFMLGSFTAIAPHHASTHVRQWCDVKWLYDKTNCWG